MAQPPAEERDTAFNVASQLGINPESLLNQISKDKAEKEAFLRQAYRNHPWDESKHPRVSAGNSGGGQFTEKGSGGSSSPSSPSSKEKGYTQSPIEKSDKIKNADKKIREKQLRDRKDQSYRETRERKIVDAERAEWNKQFRDEWKAYDKKRKSDDMQAALIADKENEELLKLASEAKTGSFEERKKSKQSLKSSLMNDI